MLFGGVLSADSLAAECYAAAACTAAAECCAAAACSKAAACTAAAECYAAPGPSAVASRGAPVTGVGGAGVGGTGAAPLPTGARRSIQRGGSGESRVDRRCGHAQTRSDCGCCGETFDGHWIRPLFGLRSDDACGPALRAGHVQLERLGYRLRLLRIAHVGPARGALDLIGLAADRGPGIAFP